MILSFIMRACARFFKGFLLVLFFETPQNEVSSLELLRLNFLRIILDLEVIHMPYSQEYLANTWRSTLTNPLLSINSADAVRAFSATPEAHRPKQRSSIWSWFSDAAANATELAKNIIANATDDIEDSKPAYSASAGSIKRNELVYQDADLAAAYGMNAATAYQEALANTAHQREVADLKAAGLNPVLSATQGRGAGTVTSAEPVAAAPGGASNSASGFQDALKNVKDILSVVKLAKSIF